MNYQNIYNKLPYLAKTIALNLKTYINYNKRFKGKHREYLLEYEKLWISSEEVVNQYQKDKLRILLTECLNYSMWYKKDMDNLNITSSDIDKDPFGVLSKLPYLKKEDRKKHVSAILNNNPIRKVKVVDYTSGTTGSPTKNFLDKESVERNFALWRRNIEVTGVKLKEKKVRFSGKILINPNKNKPPFWIYNYSENQLFMSTYHLTHTNMSSYVLKLNKFKPALIEGYPSAIYILSQFIKKNNLQINFKPKAIAVTAETLHDYQRDLISEIFDCKVFNKYASSEGSPAITECKKGNLHLNQDAGIFEFIGLNGEPANYGDLAKLVVTSFKNYKVPLLRYEIGDTILLSKEDKKCDCGCNMKIIEKIIGREDDILWTKEKGYVGRMDTTYKGLNGILKSQIIQETPKLIIINNITDETYNENDEKLFFVNLKERLGNEIEIKMNYVVDIPLTKSGKFIAVKRQFKLP